MTIKTYPGLFGKFLDRVKETSQPHAHATIGAYVAQESLDQDQADWLYGIIRRSVKDGYLSDSWWD